MKRQYVKIYCCGDCVYYNWKKRCCSRGAKEEASPRENFYSDCPLGICEEDIEEKQNEHPTKARNTQ